jgi:hypothetical protein
MVWSYFQWVHICSVVGWEAAISDVGVELIIGADVESGDIRKGEASGMGPIRDVLGWGIQGTYGEGVVFGRNDGRVGREKELR